jgi:hypothetical protein
MDDFCLFAGEKETLKRHKPVMEQFLRDTLKLETKPAATLMNNRVHGLPFLGVRIYPNMIRYKRENFKRSMTHLKQREWEYRNGVIDWTCSITYFTKPYRVRVIEQVSQNASHFAFFNRMLFKN